ncbi:hypothetical protein FBU30_002322 [Linnemannia zychae]|nr:hypothetical protein FBU30_002322 [Linnemannia zychae]
MVQNKSVVLLKYPTEYPVPGEHFEVQTKELNVKSFVPGFQIGEPMSGYGVGEIIESKNAAYPVGTIFEGSTGWQEYSIIPDASDLHILAGARESSIPLFAHLGVLGMPGITAYSSLKIIGEPKAGETIFVSAASGAVGQLVGQIAKKLGLRVVGSAGSDDKVNYLLNELKFDAAFNYKKNGTILENLKQAAPEGIDIYYENVGGETLEAALEVMNNQGRIIASEGQKFQGFITEDFAEGAVLFSTRKLDPG